MTTISYDRAPVPVRKDLPEAHRRAWSRLASAGTWWTGAERVAIAQEVRNAAHCPLCSERKEVRSPQAVQGEHASLGQLSAAAVEAVHQITNDPRRLTRTWFEKCQADGLGDTHYVELVGVVVTVVSIDAFCRGLGVSPHPLPEPLAQLADGTGEIVLQRRGPNRSGNEGWLFPGRQHAQVGNHVQMGLN